MTHLLADSPEVGLDSIDTLSHEQSLRNESTTSSTGDSDTTVKTLPQIGSDQPLVFETEKTLQRKDTNVQGQFEVDFKHKRNPTSTERAVTLYTIRFSFHFLMPFRIFWT